MKTFSLLLFFFFAGCSKTPPAKCDENRPCVLVTIAPYQFLAEEIGGASIKVKTIIPPGVNPHSFEPTIRQVAELQEGTIWFQIGEPFEKKILSTMQRQTKALVTFDLRSGVDLLPLEEGGCAHCSHTQDRHIWLSPSCLYKQAEEMAQFLSSQFPEHQSEFSSRLAQFQKKCLATEELVKHLLLPFAGNTVLVAHPAFGYFCHDFQLTQLSVEQEGKEPRPRHLEQILLAAQEKEPLFALALPQYNNKGVELMAETLSLPLHTIDPYAPDCLATIRALAALFKEGQP